MLQTNELTAVFTKAYIILTASVLRADNLRKQADKIKRTNNIDTWIKNMAKKDALLLRADRTEDRGRKVWAAVGDFQGKYINWRHLTDDNTSIYNLYVNTSDKYEEILPIAKKLS